MKIKRIIPYAVSFVSGAAVTAVAVSILWDNKERKRRQKEVNELMALNEDIIMYGEPDIEALSCLTSNGLCCIADRINEYPSCGFIHFSRKCASVVLRRIAECMNEGEKLCEFESRHKSVGTED